MQESQKILDATIRPRTASESLLQYAQCIMDVKTNLEVNNLVTEIYRGQLSPKSLLPKLLTQSPLTLDTIEKVGKGVTDVLW